jgi:hypothetical protein
LPPFFLKLTRMWERSSEVSKTKRMCFSNPPPIHSEAKRCTVRFCSRVPPMKPTLSVMRRWSRVKL